MNENIEEQLPFLGPNSMQFESFSALTEFIRNKEKTECIQLFIRNSRSIEAAAKRGITRYIKDGLKYYEITYRCIHSGTRKSRSTGIRPKQSSFRKECPFLLRLHASRDGQSLIVANFVDEHNHQHTEETFSLLPRQRQFHGPTKEIVKHMVKLRANKKPLQGELFNTKKVILKDLHNINVANSEEDSLKNALAYLMQREENCLEVLKDSDNNFQGLFYQDAEMKRIYEVFPEILFVDSIHKVSNLKVPLYIFAVEDGNGEIEIVAFFLAATEDSVAMKKTVNIFKKHNSAWTKTVAVMTDKDFQERSVFQEEFPGAHLLICLFHTLRAFKRDINCEEMGITTAERTTCLQFAEKLAYARNEENYKEILEEAQKLHLSAFLDYFMTNWHSIRKEWLPALQDVFTLGNKTSKRLESINSKIMQVIKRHSELPELFQNLDCLLLSLRTERDERTARFHLKVPLNLTFIHDDQQKYLQCLTPFAYELVDGWFKKKNNVTIIEEDPEHEECKMLSSQGVILVTSSRCSCTFWRSIKLPCQHILHVREVKGLSLFSESLIPNRWRKNCYLSNSRLVNTAPDEESSFEMMSEISQKVLSQHEKFCIVAEKTQTIASLASEAPGRLEVLDQIIELWRAGKEVFVGEIPTGSIEIEMDTVLASKKACVVTGDETEVNDSTKNLSTNPSPSSIDIPTDSIEIEMDTIPASKKARAVTRGESEFNDPSKNLSTNPSSGSIEIEMDTIPTSRKACIVTRGESKVNDPTKYLSTNPSPDEHKKVYMTIVDKTKKNLVILVPLKNVKTKTSAAQEVLDYHSKQQQKRVIEPEPEYILP